MDQTIKSVDKGKILLTCRVIFDEGGSSAVMDKTFLNGFISRDYRFLACAIPGVCSCNRLCPRYEPNASNPATSVTQC